MTTVKELKDMLTHVPDDALVLVPMTRGDGTIEYVFPVVEPALVQHTSSVSFENASLPDKALRALIFR